MRHDTILEDGSYQNENSCIHVVLRIRPQLAEEGENDRCIRVPHEVGTSLSKSSPRFQSVRIEENGENEQSQDFTFDHVLNPSTNQEELYSKCVESLVESSLDGYNASILAYGQTGSGKTHTIIGDLGKDVPDNKAGIIPRALQYDIAQDSCKA